MRVEKQKYSPAIRPELIDRLYKERKRRHIPMTKLINRILEKALPEWEAEALPEVRSTGQNGTRTWQRNGGKQQQA